MEAEIKSHFEEEKDLKSKINSTDAKIEELKLSIMNILEDNEKNNGRKTSSEVIEAKKMNLQVLQKAKEDLISQYNTVFSKRINIKSVNKFVKN